jgi:hypothetical protein
MNFEREPLTSVLFPLARGEADEALIWLQIDRLSLPKEEGR